MNYLILSSEWGSGYDSAAISLAQSAEKNGDRSVLADPSVFQSGNLKLYRKLLGRYKGSRTVRRYANKLYDKTSLGSLGLMTPSLTFFQNLNEYIRSELFDAVICVGRDIINKLTESDHAISAPTYAVLSDYVCPSVKGLTRYDAVFVSHELLRAELISKNFPESRITVSGVPVPLCFAEQMGKAAARNYLVIPQSKRIYLIHCSDLSTGSVEDLCDGLIREENTDFAVYLLVGRDGDMKDDLAAYYGQSGTVRVITYTEKVNVYTEAADVIISKPVGVISAECAASSVPLVHIVSMTGHDKNADFLAAREMCVKALGVRDAVRKATRLAESKVLADRMKIIQRINCPRDGADSVIRAIGASLADAKTVKDGLTL